MSERVLIIDDEEDFLDVLSERLQTRGVDVTTATSAAEGLDQVGDGGFDAIVLDMKMPGMDGIEALKALREKRPELQVILLTGHATVDKGIQAMKLGAMDFLEKPAKIDVLLEKIHRASARKMLLVEERTQEKMRDILAEKGW